MFNFLKYLISNRDVTFRQLTLPSLHQVLQTPVLKLKACRKIQQVSSVLPTTPHRHRLHFRIQRRHSWCEIPYWKVINPGATIRQRRRRNSQSLSDKKK